MSTSRRGWTLACCTILGILGMGAVATAQDHPAGEPAAPKSKGNEVFNVVEVRTTILSIKPEGSPVRGGELVCELNEPTLLGQLAQRVIAMNRAEIEYVNAKRDRLLAEIAVVEYERGSFRQERETTLGEVALAESERRRAEDRIKWSDRMHARGFVSRAQNVADKISLQQKVFAFEQAVTKLKVLEEYTRNKTIKELQASVEKTLSDEAAKKAAYEQERSAQRRLARQIENCKVFAPSSGRLEYAAPAKEGSAVEPGQLLFRVVPDDPSEDDAR